MNKHMTYNYIKIAGANVVSWWNANFQLGTSFDGESFRIWTSWAIALLVGILTVFKIIKDLRKK